MNQLTNEYNKLKKEVSDFQDIIVKLAATNSEIKNLYKGCQILFSPLIYKPDIMLIGINPGAGYFNMYHKPVNKLDPQAYFEYLEENQNYDLQRETLKVFEIAQKSHLLKNTVKTNYIYFSTYNEKLLYELTARLCREGLEPWELFNKWTMKLITIIEPKIIICEGKSAFDQVCNTLNKNSNDAIWKEDSFTSLQFENFKLIGYKRNRSYIRKKPELGSFLSKELVYFQETVLSK